MTELKHFEDLWVSCEEFHKQTNNSTSSILEEIKMKLSLYQTIIDKSTLSKEENKKIKEKIFGEILLSFTALSLEEDINVYQILNSALQLRILEFGLNSK